jgi:hypothetical protein
MVYAMYLSRNQIAAGGGLPTPSQCHNNMVYHIFIACNEVAAAIYYAVNIASTGREGRTVP